MNNGTPTFILGIAPGARKIGISVFRDEDLIFFALKTIRKQKKEESLVKLKQILEMMIANYKIDFVAIEKIVFVQQHRSFVKIVYDEIKSFLGLQGVKFFEYNPKRIRETICGFQRSTKRRTAFLLAEKYPELAPNFNVAHFWQKQYFSQLFDAVATALVCVIELRETKTFSGKPSNQNNDVRLQ